MAATLMVKIGERWYTVEVGDLDEFPIQAVVDGELVEVEMSDMPTAMSPQTDAADLPVQSREPSRPPPTPPSQRAARAAPSEEPSRSFKTPMPGVIVSVAVKEGDQVVTGDPICILEAMKMQQTLRADWSGIVQAVHVTAGEQVVDGQAIADLE
ncbi:MAG: biotin/lipoyl-binding protein [Chloroflexi bacterium]|nr:biotin/lipoyl-binding protein [Chloroflexota bacterium]